MEAIRKASYKRNGVPDQEARRRHALARQKSARQDKQNALRLISLHEEQEVSVAPQPNSVFDPKTDEQYAKVASAEKFYASQLQIPEWMVDVPPNLNGNSKAEEGWFVLPRPEGKHCLLISSKASTVARERSGRLLHRFQSGLPNGSPRTMAGSDDYCILDCIFNEESESFFVIDLICWKGQTLYDCSAEFRFFWTQSRLGELGDLSKQTTGNDFSITLVPFYECTPDGIATAYNGACNYQRDGLLFFNKTGTYWTGLTPLVLKWKDDKCSRFPIDSPDGQTPFPTQTVVLRIDPNLNLRTLGGEQLGSIPLDFLKSHNLAPGHLVRFTITGLEVNQPNLVTSEEVARVNAPMANHHFDLKLEGMNFVGKCKASRAIPDSACKILFQYLARSQPMKIEDVIGVAAQQVLIGMDATLTN